MSIKCNILTAVPLALALLSVFTFIITLSSEFVFLAIAAACTFLLRVLLHGCDRISECESGDREWLS